MYCSMIIDAEGLSLIIDASVTFISKWIQVLTDGQLRMKSLVEL